MPGPLKTKKAKPTPKKKPTPEQRATKTEVTQDARLTLEINGETYTADIKLWKELKKDGKAAS